MKSRWFLVLVAVLGLALFASLPIPVATAATPSIKLVLGGTGATPWAIGPLAPGDNGTKSVTLSNTGFNGGVVTIWISDIVNSEGDNPQSETGNTTEPGELGDYILLNVSSTNLSTDFILPAKTSDFPQSDNDTKHIYLNPLKAFSTLNLQWEWQPPLETGDDIQGDNLSFTINYMLEEVPPLPSTPSPDQRGGGEGAPPLSTVATNFFGTTGSFEGDSTGTIQTTVTVTSADGKLTVTLPSGTKCLDKNGNPLTALTININASPPAPPAAANIIGLAYNFGPDGATFAPSITMILSYDSNTLPAGVAEQGIVIAYYDAAAGEWVEIPGTVSIANHTITAQVNHFTTFAIIGKAKPELSPMPPPAPTPIPAPSPPLPPAPVPPQTAPANFEVRNLTVSPVQVKPGESILITYEVINTGGQSGEFMLEISIPGLLQTSQLIKLEAGQTQAFNLTLPPDNAGTYQVDIGGVKDTITIGTLPLVLPEQSRIEKVMSVWLIPAILAVIGAAALIYYIVIMMRRRKYHKLSLAPAGAVSVLAQTTEQRTLYATKHQKRVAELASAIAREMDLSKKLVKMLLLVGIIHDPGSVELPYPVAQTALQYNERLNGSGYPQKQAGDDILLEARILAVADTVETMSSPRPSRPAMGMDKALEEIKRSSSTLYDSEVVEAFGRLIDRGKFRFQTRYN